MHSDDLDRIRSYSYGYCCELQENSLLSRGNRVKCSRNVWRPSKVLYSYICVNMYFPTCILIKAQDWVKKSQNRTDEIGSFDYLNKLMCTIFRSFVRTRVTFWKHYRLKKPGCYLLPMRLRFLSHFCSVGNMSPSSLKKKYFNKCKVKTTIPSISFILEKIYVNIRSVTLLECSFEVSYHEGLDSLE